MFICVYVCVLLNILKKNSSTGKKMVKKKQHFFSVSVPKDSMLLLLCAVSEKRVNPGY